MRWSLIWPRLLAWLLIPVLLLGGSSRSLVGAHGHETTPPGPVEWGVAVEPGRCAILRQPLPQPRCLADLPTRLGT